MDTKERRNDFTYNNCSGILKVGYLNPFFQFCKVLCSPLLTPRELHMYHTTHYKRIIGYLDVFGARVSWPAAIAKLLE